MSAFRGVTNSLREALSGPVLEVAPKLLGMYLVTESEAGRAAVMLTEVEAYAGNHDPASHAYRGPTERNRSMFGAPGTLYVYRSYGIHWCANVATGPEGTGQAVLLRGGVTTAGKDLVLKRRGRRDHLTDGPGKLTQALGITGEDDGTDLLAGRRVQLIPGEELVDFKTTPRIGISVAKDRPWRFVGKEPSAIGS